MLCSLLSAYECAPNEECRVADVSRVESSVCVWEMMEVHIFNSFLINFQLKCVRVYTHR